jgi:hypothetical protein
VEEARMAQVVVGRYAAQTDEPLVVFLIGMRINHLRAVRKWAPTFMAMVRMLRRLVAQPENGFLHAHTILYWRGIGLVQYWRSFDDLERFARSPSEPHLAAWRRFNRVVGYKDGSVGFWHESYLIDPRRCEAVYGNMPVFGLAKATDHMPAIGRRETARARLGGDSEPAVPSSESDPPLT